MQKIFVCTILVIFGLTSPGLAAYDFQIGSESWVEDSAEMYVEIDENFHNFAFDLEEGESETIYLGTIYLTGGEWSITSELIAHIDFDNPNFEAIIPFSAEYWLEEDCWEDEWGEWWCDWYEEWYVWSESIEVPLGNGRRLALTLYNEYWDQIYIEAELLTTPLVVDVPESATEGDGVLAGQGTVSVQDAPTSHLVVDLLSDDTSEITLPATVTIPASQTSATFDITILDDALLDGTQTVVITASASGYGAAADTIQVHDNETATLTVDVPASATEGDGVLSGQGMVTVSAAVNSDVTVSLTSDDTTEVTVPATVTIPAGETLARFDLSIIEDAEIDGTQTVTITASVQGWTSGSDTIDVEDNKIVPMATINLTTGPDDGDINVGSGSQASTSGDLTPTGCYHNCFFDPVGESFYGSDSIYDSFLYLGSGGDLINLNDSLIPWSFSDVTTQSAISTFSAIGLEFNLEQVAEETYDPETGERTGSVLRQAYTIHNPAEDQISFELLRYIDPDILGDTSDKAGVIPGDCNTLMVYQFEDSDPGGAENPSSFVGLQAFSPAATDCAFDIRPYSALKEAIQSNGWTALDSDISVYDPDGDNILDSSQDWTYAIGHRFILEPGQTVTYESLTFFGHGNPEGYQIPNLTVTDIQVPTGAPAGETANVTWTVKNIGLEYAQGPWRDTIYLSEDHLIGNDIELATFEYDGSLGPGGTYSMTEQVVLPEERMGPHYIVVKTDSENNVIEFGGEVNNFVIDDVPIVIYQPDLELTACTASETTGMGQTIEVSWTVENIGGRHAFGSWTDKVYLSYDDQVGNDIEIASFTRSGPLESNTSYDRYENIQLPATLIGDYWVIVSTDTMDSVLEMSNDNNARVCGPITMIPPNLGIGNVSIPETASTGQQIEVQWQVTNAGPFPTTANWQDCIYLSNDDQAGEDTQLLCLNRPAPLNAGESYDRVGTVTIPNVAEGEHWIIIKVDAADIQAESNEADNTVIEGPIWIYVRYTLSVSEQGGGSVTLDPAGGIYREGTQVQLTAQPNQGWRFDRWEGDLTGSANPATIMLNANKVVRAIFIRQYTLTVNVQGGGNVVVDPAGTLFDEGTQVQLTAQPDQGWRFDHWEGDLTGSTSPATTMLDSNKLVRAVFLLSNPTNITVTPHSFYVDISWDGVQPSQYVRHYSIYVSETGFSNVQGMTPRLNVTGTSAKVAGLKDNATYYFAVTTMDLYGGERKEVSTVSATTVPDTQGPEISDIKLDDTLLADGAVLNDSGTFTLYVTDPASLSRVEFYLDGVLYHTDSNGSNHYSCFLDISSLEDGSHTLTITAYDTLGNSTSLSYSLVVALNPPSFAPVITQPLSGTIVNTPDITVSGHAERDTEIILYNNNTETGVPTAVDTNGDFSLPLTLTEGENRIQAAARNRAGTGPRSAEVLVTLDTSIPQSPTNLTAQAKSGGVIKLTWQRPLEASVKGYHLYRATSSFSSPGAAIRVNTNLITATSFNDLTPEDGTYYYRVSVVDTADNESGLSGETFAQSDSILPRAVSIQYTPTGPYDDATGRMAPGLVNLLLTVSEPLQATPFLTITPEGGIPISVDLIKTSDMEYSGLFVISETTPTGTAYAVFSGRDLVGNRGTEVDAGGVIPIDTDGPSISSIAIQPVQPIRNDENNPVSVTVTIGLNEAVKAGESPELSYLLSGEGRSEISIEPLTQVTAEPGQAQAWQGTFLLPADAGLTEVETLHFVYQGIDDLDNVSTAILCNNLFQIYQGDLPPLAPPDGLTGQSLPGGNIRLTWDEVEAAVGYQLYRQAPDEAELTAYERLGTVLEFVDEPLSDGLYAYAIASIRQENEQESVSGMSNAVEVASDSVAPGAPQSLALELLGSGINAEWVASPYTEPVTYSLYRASLAEITSVEGLTPVLTGITETTTIDTNPSPTDHSYVVTAVDNAGNESAPSNSVYLNFELLPVSSLSVLQAENDPPVVSWTHPGGNIAGYNIYLGPEGGTVKLNQDLLAGLSYTDTGYAEDERRFTVTAVDNNDHESLGRTITLPLLRATLAEGEQIKRGIMNRLEYTVESLSAGTVDNIHLKVTVNGKNHISEFFSLQPLTSNLIPVIVGGYDDLPDLATFTTTIELTPNAGEKVEIVRTSEIEVGDGMLALEILNEEFTRGGSGKVQFTLENTCDEEIEIVTATDSGLSPSDEITFYLLDADGNVLSSEPFKQNLGEGIVTLANGKTVARIPAGSVFTSQFLELPVPLSSPEEVIIKLDIAQIYFHLGRPDQVSMGGLSTRHEISLIDTAYYGEVLTIAPESSNGDEDIVITGQAVERDTGSPMPDVPLDLVISVNGFERTYEVFTAADGTFSFAFTPLAGESGLYKVRAVHPDLLDRPVQGQFVINRISITPAIINLSIPRNYEKEIIIQVGASDGTAVTNLRLIYDELDQPAGAFPEGVHVTIGSPILALESEETASFDFSIWADNTAEETGRIILKVKSDETGDDSWGSVIVNTHFSDAQPALYFAPDHVETGVAFDESVTETVILENRGVADLNDVTLAIVFDDGTPAPTWVHLNADTDQGVIAIGETREVPVAFSPASGSTAEGMYLFYLRVTSSNYPTTDIGLYVSVTQSGIGSVLFKVADIYTGTVDQNGEVIQGLAGARIKVQNEEVLTVEQTQTTDTMGEALFSDLPVGRYKCRITADNHREYVGRFWIKPGITVSEEVFLGYDLVTVEWEVVETTIGDKYEIVLNATYETDVPAAVVVPEPASITLPDMKAGDVFNGEFTLTNYGLIRAENIQFELPQDDQYLEYEFLEGIPDSLEAKESITIPYRVTALRSLDQAEEGGGSGGQSPCYLRIVRVTYDYICMIGDKVTASGTVTFTYKCEMGEITIFDQDEYTPLERWLNEGVAEYLEFGGSSQQPPSEGFICYVNIRRVEVLFEARPSIKDKDKDLYEDSVQEVGCTVNTAQREFNDEAVDLSVKAPGGNITVQRRFYGNEWHWEHLRNNLQFIPDPLGQYVESIDKGGILYEMLTDNVYVHRTYKMTGLETGYRWEDKSGEWKEYDLSGRMTSYGTRTGVTGKLIYEEGEGGKLVGIDDRNDRQVIWFEYDADGHISGVQDNDNHRVDYSYTDGRLTKVTDVLSNETTYEYDSDGRIIRTVDAAARSTIASYDDYGNVAQVIDQQGNGHFFQYDYDDVKQESYAQIKTSSGMIKEIWYNGAGETKQVDVNGRTIKKIIQDGRDLIITDEKGNLTRKEFDEWDNLTGIVYPDGSMVSFEYEHTFNQPTRETDPRGNVNEYEYDDQGNLIKKTEAVASESERVSTYTYDEYGQLLTATIESDANTESATTTFTYDDNGNVASITDPEGNTTEFLTYDSMGNLLEMKDPRGHTWTYEYDDMGRLSSQTDPLNNTTAYEYDGANNRTAIINAYLKRFEFRYDDHNNLIKAIDPYEKYRVNEYNADNLVTRTLDEEGKESVFEYDNEGRRIKAIDGAGNETVYHYDESMETVVSSDKPVRIDYPTYSRELYYDKRQRVIREVDILDESTSHSTSYTFDAVGNLVSKTDQEGNITLFEYDTLNRLIKITDPLGGVTERLLDDRGNLIALKEPNGAIMQYEYNKNDRLVQVTMPMGEETIYEYDGAGNRSALIDAKGQKVSYQYDDANRLGLVKYFSAGDHVNPVKIVQFTYNKLAKLVSYNDGITSATYTYDDLQRKIAESVDYGPFTLSYSYTYYTNGLKNSFTGPDGITCNYLYDANNRISSIAIPGQGQITYNAYRWNSPAKITLPGGTTEEFGYDPRMQPKSITAKDPGQNDIMAYNYEHSPAGNITAKNTEHGDYAYQYDELYRLIEATNLTIAEEAYTYDALGNRLTAAGVEGAWSYDKNNELLGYGAVSLEYDDNGNMTRKTIDGQVVNYIYDVENRMVRVEDGNGSIIAEYFYDPFGRRMWKDMNGIRTYYLYSEEGLIGEYDSIGNEIKTYGYMPNSVWTTNPLFQNVGGGYYWYQNDHLGTPQKIVETNGRTVWSANYDTFGNVDVGLAEIDNNLGFPGQYYDAETGLYYNWNRYYDSTIGRYLRLDPLNEDLNLYTYANNNPLSYADPPGFCPLGGDILQEIGQEGLEALGYGALGEFVDAWSRGLGEAIWGKGTLLDTWQEIGQEGLEALGYGALGEFVDAWSRGLGEAIWGKGTLLDTWQEIGKKGLKALPFSEKLPLGEIVDHLSRILPKMYYDNRLRRDQERARKLLEERRRYDSRYGSAPRLYEENEVTFDFIPTDKGRILIERRGGGVR